MDPDLLMVLGVVLAVFTIPSMISAYSDRRAPRASAVTVLIAGGMILWAMAIKPGGYRISDLPDVFVEVAGRYLP